MKTPADYCADIAKALEMGPTEGEWKAGAAADVRIGNRRICHAYAGAPLSIGDGVVRAKANAKFIAACHPAALRSILEAREQDAMAVRILVEEDERLRQQVAALRRLLSECQDAIDWCAQECGHKDAPALAERIQTTLGDPK